MTLMLHKYDTSRTRSLLALAAVSGAIAALPAAAQSSCAPDDGYADGLVSYVAEVEACLDKSEFDATRETGIFDRTNAVRTRAGVSPLNRRASLDRAARAHALDMAARGYAGHNDLEGRGHIYRMRALDRQVLASATGANVAVLDADASVSDIYAAISGDSANRENLVHGGFTDTGLGIAEANGRLYVVQMLTTVDGELETPLPLQIAGATSFSPRVNQDYFRTAGWSLSDASGNRLAGGTLMRMHDVAFDRDDTGYLDVLVELDADTYVLRGPLVTRR
ncbi:CAP domain-containing protein [Henriciella marina]|uniref:CAP domain-containing protein n=1 Tax=Henriciella marina TaxID=453851 RepID=UPI0009FCFB4E|nr:CAP domain-containing protein [Henriciella marina]